MAGFINRNIKRAIRLYFTFRTVNWIKFFQLHDKDADVVLLMRPQFSSIFKDTFEPDIILMGVLVKMGLRFRVYRGSEYGQFQNKTIIYNASYFMNEHGFQNYSAFQTYVMQQLEYQGNRVFPRADEIVYWENKEYMYAKFKELGIKHPDTSMFHSYEEFKQAKLKFPLLIKEAHSHAAEGVYKVNTPEDAERLLTSEKFMSNNRVIIAQQLLNMRKDLRVTVLGDEIVLHYWRTNPSDEWKPTSTSHGSGVDFVTFPEKWRSYFMEVNRKLNLKSGGYDYAWENDDLETEPICLEVSPTYQPNPPADITGRPYTYGQWKKKLLLKDSWDEAYTEFYFGIRYKVFESYFKEAGVLKK
ncbi:MAG: hypothetical protein U0T74_07765 [Chitinophagales bacterium]